MLQRQSSSVLQRQRQRQDGIRQSLAHFTIFFLYKPANTLSRDIYIEYFPSRAFKREGQSQCWGQVAKPCLNFTIQFKRSN